MVLSRYRTAAICRSCRDLTHKEGFALVDKHEWDCPECGNAMQCECVIGADASGSGLTERLYSCGKCGSAWSTQEIDGVETPPQRYFLG